MTDLFLSSRDLQTSPGTSIGEHVVFSHLELRQPLVSGELLFRSKIKIFEL